MFQSFSGSVRELISEFDGCSGRKAGRIALSYAKIPAAVLGFNETEGLLSELRAQVKNVNPERLGRIGKLADWKGYHKSSGVFMNKEQVAEAVRQVKERCCDSLTRLEERVPAELEKDSQRQKVTDIQDLS